MSSAITALLREALKTPSTVVMPLLGWSCAHPSPICRTSLTKYAVERRRLARARKQRPLEILAVSAQETVRIASCRAGGTGFEPAIRYNPDNRLAGGPIRPLWHPPNCDIRATRSKAEGVGFEPTVTGYRHRGFQDHRLKPLGHPSTNMYFGGDRCILAWLCRDGQAGIVCIMMRRTIKS